MFKELTAVVNESIKLCGQPKPISYQDDSVESSNAGIQQKKQDYNNLMLEVAKEEKNHFCKQEEEIIVELRRVETEFLSNNNENQINEVNMHYQLVKHIVHASFFFHIRLSYPLGNQLSFTRNRNARQTVAKFCRTCFEHGYARGNCGQTRQFR